MPRTRAFSLIEILVVIAIVAILAATAAGGFTGYRARARTAGARADALSFSRESKSVYTRDRNYDVLDDAEKFFRDFKWSSGKVQQRYITIILAVAAVPTSFTASFYHPLASATDLARYLVSSKSGIGGLQDTPLIGAAGKMIHLHEPDSNNPDAACLSGGVGIACYHSWQH